MNVKVNISPLYFTLFRQWGKGGGNFTFPIVFTQNCFCGFLTRSFGGYEYSLIITTLSLTEIRWESHGYDNCWGDNNGYVLVIGK